MRKIKITYVEFLGYYEDDLEQNLVKIQSFSISDAMRKLGKLEETPKTGDMEQ